MTERQQNAVTKAKRVLAVLAITVLLLGGLRIAAYLYTLPPTYNVSGVDLVNLYYNPEDYDVTQAGGVADIIVSEDLAKTSSVNAVTAVVFDFRGYDTLGESFILLTAISGSMAILRRGGKGLGHEKGH